MPRFSRRRRFKRRYRGRSIRSRYRRRLRRSYTGRRKRYFTRKQLVPARNVVKITLSTPFRIKNAAANGDFSVGGAWRLNTLEGIYTASGSLPRGQNGIFNIVGGASTTTSTPIGDFGSTLQTTSNKNRMVVSSNFWHMHNLYQRYRIRRVKQTMSCVYDPSPNSIDQTQSANRFGSLTMFFTDDVDSITTDAFSNNQIWARPFVQSHRHATVKTVGNGHVSASKATLSRSVKSLISDRTVGTSDDWIGNCVKTISDTDERYRSPSKFVYGGFVFTPYGLFSSEIFPLNMIILSGYITWTFHVEFFAPHDNSDTYYPI